MVASRRTDGSQRVVVVLASEVVVGIDEFLEEIVNVGALFLVVECLLGDCLCIGLGCALQLAAVVAAAVVDPIHVFADRLGKRPIDIRCRIDVPTLSVRF